MHGRSRPFEVRRAVRADGLAFDGTWPRLGTAQRDSLRRGLGFVLALAMSCLMPIYAPLIRQRLDGPSVHTAAAHVRTDGLTRGPHRTPRPEDPRG